MKIRLYKRAGEYQEVDVTHEQIADASMVIHEGTYYYFDRIDTSTGRIIGVPMFKEGIAPVNLTPDHKD